MEVPKSDSCCHNASAKVKAKVLEWQQPAPMTEILEGNHGAGVRMAKGPTKQLQALRISSDSVGIGVATDPSGKAELQVQETKHE